MTRHATSAGQQSHAVQESQAKVADSKPRDRAGFERAVGRAQRQHHAGKAPGAATPAATSAATSSATLNSGAGATPRRKPALHGKQSLEPMAKRGDETHEAALRAALLNAPSQLTQAAPGALTATATGIDGTGGIGQAGRTGATSALVHRLVDEVARATDVARVAGQPRLDVELDLGRLGGGRLTVSKGTKGLDLQLQLDGPRARELAAARIDDLRQGLNARGLEIASLELGSADASRRSAFGAASYAANPELQQGTPKDPRDGHPSPDDHDPGHDEPEAKHHDEEAAR